MGDGQGVGKVLVGEKGKITQDGRDQAEPEQHLELAELGAEGETKSQRLLYLLLLYCLRGSGCESERGDGKKTGGTEWQKDEQSNALNGRRLLHVRTGRGGRGCSPPSAL